MVRFTQAVQFKRPSETRLMPNTTYDPIALFDSSFSGQVQEDLLRGVAEAYPSSYRITADCMDEPEVRDAWPHVRRGRVEGVLRRVAQRFGLSVREDTNRSHNRHVVIGGGNFIVTQSVVGEPGLTVRHACFREAEAVNNYPLFADLQDDDPPGEDTKYYAILVHGPSRTDPMQLGFAFIKFPTPGGHFLEVDIDLMKRYPEVIAGPATFEEEVIPDAIEPQIRTDLPEKDEV